MPIIDLHCDTIYEIYYNGKGQDLYSNDLQVDIKKMQQSDVMAQMFALYMDQDIMKNNHQSPMAYATELKKTLDQQIMLNKAHIQYASNYEDIQKNRYENKISALMSIEGGEVLEGKIDNLQQIYDWRVRALTLTWNYPNELGFSHTGKEGLTSFGKEVVEYANELGILLDISHLSDQGFWDIVELSTDPIIASHSNARVICNHTRNLTDEMIGAIAEKGGLIGINLYGLFLSYQGHSTIEDIIRHIQHIYQVGGIESIALGSDFDGFVGDAEVSNAAQWGKIIEALGKVKISQTDIDKITYKNALRVIKDVL